MRLSISTKGAGIWTWASSDQNSEPDLVMASPWRCRDDGSPRRRGPAATTPMRKGSIGPRSSTGNGHCSSTLPLADDLLGVGDDRLQMLLVLEALGVDLVDGLGP